MTALAGLALSPALTSTAQAAGLPPTVLHGQFGPAEPMKHKGDLSISDWGLRYRAGQQDSNLTITQVGSDKLRYVDTGTQSWKTLAPGCGKISVPRGIGAVCTVPPRWRNASHMFLEIWPRLGDDVINTSSLGPKYRSWVLADDGNDVVRTGAGDDFINGAQANDIARGGRGDDWIRTGIGSDRLYGGAGNDKLVGADGNDWLAGGTGNDRVYGSNGSDTLYGRSGKNLVNCGPGGDRAWANSSTRVNQCERVQH